MNNEEANLERLGRTEVMTILVEFLEVVDDWAKRRSIDVFEVQIAVQMLAGLMRTARTDYSEPNRRGIYRSV